MPNDPRVEVEAPALSWVSVIAILSSLAGVGQVAADRDARAISVFGRHGTFEDESLNRLSRFFK